MEIAKESSITHTEVVKVAAKWLTRNHPIVITEMACSNEEPDVIGWSGGISTLIEAKASRSDFLSDKRKSFRSKPESGIGNYRYYATPKGLISIDELPSQWGLLEWDGKRMWRTKAPEFFQEINHKQEKVLLISTLRRIGQQSPQGVSIKAYYYQTENRTTLSLDVSDIEVSA